MASDNKDTFSAQEKDAIKARARELVAEKKTAKKREEGEKALQEALEKMDGNDRSMAVRLHEIISENFPGLWPRTWYGMPAYSLEGKVICFFQAAGRFDSRYASFGFDTAARLDDGNMWATSFALLRLGAEEETRILGLIRKAIG